MIKEVIRWQNGMVMAFDEHGRQILEYNGPILEVRERILRDAPESARFTEAVWGTGENRVIDRRDL